MLIGKVTWRSKELAIASDSNRIILPSNIQDIKCSSCLAVFKIIRDKIGTAIPINAMGPQNAVVNPVKTEEIKIKKKRADE